MLIIVYFVFLSSNFLFIKSEDRNIINIEVSDQTGSCEINSTSYNFTEGQNVTVIVQPYMYINFGWWNVVSAAGATHEIYGNLKANQSNEENEPYKTINYTQTVNKTMEGLWEFKFYFYKDIYLEGPRVIQTGRSYYTQSVCKINATIVPVTSTPTCNPHTALSPIKASDNKYKTLIIIASVVSAVLVAIIIAQAAYIVFLKAKAQKLITLNTHNNLSKKSESIPNDTARYCSNPGQKIMKEPILEDNNRDSVIYEAPNIEISSNTRMPMQPPQPPAIATMPRTPRPDHNLKIGSQTMLASALNSPARSPMSDNHPPNFQRQIEREINLANRPKLPLPNETQTQGPMYQELYEDMESQENTYEPPPVVNTMPPRLPVPPKKVPTGNLLDVKENTLKSRQGNKPPVTAKPTPPRSTIMTASEFEQALKKRNENSLPRGNPGHMMHPQQQEKTHRRRPVADGATNELEEALRRRNNGDGATNELEEAFNRRNKVMQVPIVSIPEPSSARNSPKPKPPPAMKPPLKMPQPVQEEIYYNEASSDEEWTYEPLKPFKNYDPNIYNV